MVTRTMRPDLAPLRLARRALSLGGRQDRAQRLSLYSITIPGLDVVSEWRLVHDRLLDDFPAIEEVLPTTMQATLLIAYTEPAEVDGWLDSITGAILSRRLGSSRSLTLTKTAFSMPDRIGNLPAH